MTTRDKELTPLEQLKHWLTVGLPDIEVFDAVAKQMTREEEAEYLRYLDRHNKVYGDGFGPLPPEDAEEK